jgi:hypothetical protein
VSQAEQDERTVAWIARKILLDHMRAAPKAATISTPANLQG